MNMSDITKEHVDLFYQKLRQEVESSGYHLNPDEEFTKELLKSILINQNRYGYGACPCRLASGVKEEDLDIICPCDYRDLDLFDYGACYCGLYVTGDILRGEKQLTAIPERRPGPDDRIQPNMVQRDLPVTLSLPVWRCKVCGYLCAREEPPENCPICKVGKERFERFM